MKKEFKPFDVTITKQGAKNAYPAIWYSGRDGETFTVVKSKQWPSVYEVFSGRFAGKIIDPIDCALSPTNNK